MCAGIENDAARKVKNALDNAASIVIYCTVSLALS